MRFHRRRISLRILEARQHPDGSKRRIHRMIVTRLHIARTDNMDHLCPKPELQKGANSVGSRLLLKKYQVDDARDEHDGGYRN